MIFGLMEAPTEACPTCAGNGYLRLVDWSGQGVICGDCEMQAGDEQSA